MSFDSHYTDFFASNPSLRISVNYSTPPSTRTFNDLPPEIHTRIIHFLPQKDILTYTSLSHRLRREVFRSEKGQAIYQIIFDIAIAKHDIKRVELFLRMRNREKGELTYPEINPAACNNYALRIAAENGWTEIVRFLLRQPGVYANAEDDEPIQWASRQGHLEIVQLLLQHHVVDPSAKKNYALQYACANGHHEVVKLLLEQPAVNPAADNNYALRIAAKESHPKVIELLLSHELVSSAADNECAFRWAARLGHIEAVKLFLEYGVHFSAENDYALRWAARNDHKDMVHLLIHVKEGSSTIRLKLNCQYIQL